MGCVISKSTDDGPKPQVAIAEDMDSSYQNWSEGGGIVYDEPFKFDNVRVDTQNSTLDMDVSNHFYENFGNVKCAKLKERPNSTSTVQEKTRTQSDNHPRAVINPKCCEVQMTTSSPWPMGSRLSDSKVRASISEPFLQKEGILTQLPTMQQPEQEATKSSHYENLFDSDYTSEKGSIESEECKDMYVVMRSAVHEEEPDMSADMYIVVNSREDINALQDEEDDYSHIREWKGHPPVDQYCNIASSASMQELIESKKLHQVPHLSHHPQSTTVS